jgi:hypothetical protein
MAAAEEDGSSFFGCLPPDRRTSTAVSARQRAREASKQSHVRQADIELTCSGDRGLGGHGFRSDQERGKVAAEPERERDLIGLWKMPMRGVEDATEEKRAGRL